MAFSRGNRGQAVRHWCRAYAKNMGASRRSRRKWFRLLTRYLVGSLPLGLNHGEGHEKLVKPQAWAQDARKGAVSVGL